MEEGGDAVCWLDQVCSECGAMPTGEDEDARCWRCGTPRNPEASERAVHDV